MTGGRRTLLLLLVLFIGLAGLLLFQNQQLAQLPVPTPLVSLRVFPDMAVLDIVSIRLYNPNTETSFTIVRGEDGEWIPGDREGTLQEDAGTNLARTVVLLPYTETLPLSEGMDLRPYGFAPNGTMFVQVLLADGSSHTIAIGSLTPSGDRVYALVDDRPEIYLLIPQAVAYLITQLRTPPIA